MNSNNLPGDGTMFDKDLEVGKLTDMVSVLSANAGAMADVQDCLGDLLTKLCEIGDFNGSSKEEGS